MNAIKKFLKEENGVTALEYGVLAALIVVAVATFGGQVATWFGTLWSKIDPGV